jgi:microcystin-dependent protein/type II secretory pathway pseudopilin PulG
MQKYQKKFKSTNNKSFSIVELTIVLLIISIITTTSVSLYSSKIEVENIKSTKVKMAVIYESIKAFVKMYKRMPCPADPKSKIDAPEFGIESVASSEDGESSTDCNESYKSSDDKIYQGAVPIYALGLNNEMIKDDFGYKFSYVIVKGHQNAFDYNNIDESISNVTDSFEYAAREDSAITLTSGSNYHEEKPLFLLISHGKNGYGAYNYNGNLELSTPQQQDDKKHEEYNYQYSDPSSNASDITNEFYYDGNLAFDDIVFFKTKNNLIMDIDWQEKLCATPVCIEKKTSVEEYEDNETLDASYCGDGDYEYKLDIISKPGDTTEVKKFVYDINNNETTQSCTENTPQEEGFFTYKTTCGKYGIWNINATKKECQTANVTVTGNYIIAMWSGNKDNVPEGWSVCDGKIPDENGTLVSEANEPDLRNKFIVGAGLDGNDKGVYDAKDGNEYHELTNGCSNTTDDGNNCYKVNEKGGEDKHSLTADELASHSHASGNLKYEWRDEYGQSEAGDSDDGKIDIDTDGGDDANDAKREGPITGEVDNTGGDDAHENRPPYYALYFICKKL